MGAGVVCTPVLQTGVSQAIAETGAGRRPCEPGSRLQRSWSGSVKARPPDGRATGDCIAGTGTPRRALASNANARTPPIGPGVPAAGFMPGRACKGRVLPGRCQRPGQALRSGGNHRAAVRLPGGRRIPSKAEQQPSGHCVGLNVRGSDPVGPVRIGRVLAEGEGHRAVWMACDDAGAHRAVRETQRSEKAVRVVCVDPERRHEATGQRVEKGRCDHHATSGPRDSNTDSMASRPSTRPAEALSTRASA